MLDAGQHQTYAWTLTICVLTKIPPLVYTTWKSQGWQQASFTPCVFRAGTSVITLQACRLCGTCQTQVLQRRLSYYFLGPQDCRPVMPMTDVLSCLWLVSINRRMDNGVNILQTTDTCNSMGASQNITISERSQKLLLDSFQMKVKSRQMDMLGFLIRKGHRE